MACYQPRPAWPDLAAGGRYVFTYNTRLDLGGQVLVPCGQCNGCRRDLARDAALRCVHELSLHDAASFITCTHSDSHFPTSQDDWERKNVLFLKRMRSASPGAVLRFFGCLELGPKTQRPHSHYLVFGRDFSRDEPVGKGDSGSICYRSDELDAIWGLGQASVGDLTAAACKYVAAYTMKKQSRGAPDEFEHVAHPLSGELLPLVQARSFGVSRRPGIGAGWFDKYGEQAVREGHCIVNGQRVPLPAYYSRLGKRAFGNLGGDAQADAALVASKLSHEFSPERLAVREEVAEARSRFYGKAGAL